MSVQTCPESLEEKAAVTWACEEHTEEDMSTDKGENVAGLPAEPTPPK